MFIRRPLRLSCIGHLSRKLHNAAKRPYGPRIFDSINETFCDDPPSKEAQAALQRSKREKYTLPQIKFEDCRKPISIGDLILMNRSECVVVKLPSELDGPYLVVDARGLLQEAKLASIEARLGSFVSPHFIKKIQISSPDHPEIVNPILFSLIGPKLRAFYNNASIESQEILGTLRDILLLYQKEDRAVSMSFFDLLSLLETFKSRKKKMSKTEREELEEQTFPSVPANESTPTEFRPEFVYGVRMALDYYKFVNRIQTNIRYQGNYAITIFSRQAERNNIYLINRDTAVDRGSAVPDRLVKYVKDYALDNLNLDSPQAEGIALQLLRSHDKTHAIENSYHSALKYADYYGVINKRGPALDRSRYDFFTKASLSDHDQKLDADITFDANIDVLEHVRQSFEQPIYCIDSADAEEIDDGISLEIISGNIWKVGIHVVNPTSVFDDSTSLIERVYSRPYTSYLPSGSIPMLPSAFSNAFGFKHGEARRTLSVWFTYDYKTKKFLDSGVAAYSAKNIVQLTYKELEEQLNQGTAPEELKAAVEVTNHLRESRRSKMGVFQTIQSDAPRPFYDEKSKRVSVNAITPTPLATQIVTELMIHANESVGSILNENNIPCVFRRQNMHLPTEDLKTQFKTIVIETGFLGLEWMSSLSRAFLSVDGGRHESMGASNYTTFTSPLRRGIDILHHFQLQSYLLNKPAPLSARKLEAMIPWLTTSQQLIRQCQNVIERYWRLSYLETQNVKNVKGIILRHTNEHTHIFLPEWHVTAEMKLLNTRKPIGHADNYKLLHLDAMADVLTVE